MKVGLLTTTQKESLQGQLIQAYWYFHPIQDCNGNWVISIEEMESSIYPENDFVKTLPLIDWCEPILSGSTMN